MTLPVIDDTHAPDLTSWVEGADGHPDFPIQNLPFGVFTPGDRDDGRIGVAIGDSILDVRAAFRKGLLEGPPAEVLEACTLNAYMASPADQRRALRRSLSRYLSDPARKAEGRALLHPASACVMKLPAAIGDYTDFYVGIRHAENVGRLFRPDNPLLPNYKYVPIGYHGRASSVRPSGAPVIRPNGQTKAPDAEAPTYGPVRRLDYELEIGIWIGSANPLGRPVPVSEALDHVAGFCVLNDWSARDLQAWEYQPLGPFLSKSFLTTISPWVVTIEAMAPFFTAQPGRPEGDPDPLPYLWNETDQASGALSVALGVEFASAAMRARGEAPTPIAQSAARHMYWTVAQMVAHHTSNGCNLNAGDLLGSGTISGPERTTYGSLLEITRGGAEPLEVSGEAVTFLEDGDEVRLTARASAPGRVAIGFGPCEGVISPAPVL